MRKWTIKYIDWRLTTAYPTGWRYALRHPIIFVKDVWNYLNWCQMMDDTNHTQSLKTIFCHKMSCEKKVDKQYEFCDFHKDKN